MRMIIVDKAIPTTPKPKIDWETIFPASGSSVVASWKLSRLTKVRASSRSTALVAPGWSATSWAIVPAAAGEFGSTSPVCVWNWDAAAITTQLVARKKGMKRPIERSKIEKPR